MEPCQPVGPISIAAASRGSHIARKNLLLAFRTTPADAEPSAGGLEYLSIAPESMGRI